MNLRTVVLSIAAILLCIGGYKLAQTIRAKSTNTDTLTLGITAGYAPFISMNEQGQYEGFDIDVAQALGITLHKKVVFKDLGSMTSLMMALQQGSVDAIIWGLSITQERLQKLAMVHYQGVSTTSYPLLFWEKIPAGVAGLADMEGKTVCVEPTSAQSAVLNKYPGIMIMPTEKVDDALLNIQYGKANAALVEPAIAKKFKTKYPQIQILDIPLAQEEQELGIGIAIRRDNTALIAQVQQAIDELKNNGSIAQFEKKWGIE
ncbi:transporter substrate-binding domain-containing protein [Candidatus Dependentiae bacterium]|nr:transporter substrate-binding domain-containing protein [Candidatus Dependentiae bacterium]